MDNKYQAIITDLQVQSVLDYIKKHDFFAFDTETTGLNTRKDKVIGMSFAAEHNVAFYVSRFTWCIEKEELERQVSEEAFVKILEALAKKELLMWNASFDCRMVQSNFNIDLLKSLAAEVMLMKHTVNEDAFFSLKKTAIELQEYLGMDMEEAANKEQIELKENIIKNGGTVTKANYEMFKADLNIMARYACADADLTLKIAHYYLDVLQAESLEEFYFDKEVMPLYKEVTVKMESKGVQLDLPMIEHAKVEIEEDITLLENMVLEELKAGKAYASWKIALAAKNYPAKKTGKFGQKFVEFMGLDLPLTKAGKYSMGKKAVETLADGPAKQFLLSGDGTHLPEDVVAVIQEELINENGDDLNISSKKQMGEIVFDYMDIKPLSRTMGGSPQFNETFITHLQELGYGWGRNLSNYNKLIKVRGTYIDRFLDNHEDGIYYPSFKQHGTISGRYGSDLQQLPRPKEEGELDEIILKHANKVRAFFIAGKGRKFIDNDYESLEPHVFAHVSGDEGLRDIFRNGHDFYSTIAIATEGLEGVSSDKKADNYLGKVNKPLRQKAKAYSLGVPYGMKGYALGMSLEVTTEEAEDLIEAYLSGFPNLRLWMTNSELMAKNLGCVSSEVGRVRHLPKVKAIYKKHGEKLLDFKYRNKLIKRHANRLGKEEAKKLINGMYKDYKNGLNNAKNFQIQSLSASIVNLAAIEINREFIRRHIDGWVALQIHDQLVMNVPEDKAEECRKLVEDIMVNNYKLSLALKAPAEICDNLKDGH